jgi:hypothetical protein
LLRAAALYEEAHGDAAGRIPASVDILYLTGWAPHAAQPQPLRPGSARTRLAEALGSAERSAGEKAGGEESGGGKPGAQHPDGGAKKGGKP